MASRYPSSFHMDFCYSPVKVTKNGLTFYVPCGRCNGCLLQKSNSLSMRLGDEIESSSHAIFFTLTYDNIHVPKMMCRKEGDLYHWFSAPGNLRFNGRYDVPRESIDFYSPFTLDAPLNHYHDNRCVGYLCKRDIQLYLKLLRKSIYDSFNISSGIFRYFITAEYGPGKDPNQGKFRPHYHGIILPCNCEVAEDLLRHSLYACWQMCDKDRFDYYTKYCDSGTRSYVAEYITSTSSLPPLLQQTQEIKPFNLSSRKAGTIGVSSFDRKKVSEDIERGIDSYIKSVPRIERNYLFLYPPQVTTSLFPKCSRYRLLSFNGLLRIYGYLYNLREGGSKFYALFDGLDRFSSQDYQASKTCLKVCDMMSWTPYHYVEVLVDFYNRKAHRALCYQYEWQQEHIDDPYLCIAWYNNSLDYLKDVHYVDIHKDADMKVFPFYDARNWFLQSFGFHAESVDDICSVVLSRLDNSYYQLEVDSILEGADKSKKVNSLVGFSPHIV